jgi:hypothetical protein
MMGIFNKTILSRTAGLLFALVLALSLILNPAGAVYSQASFGNDSPVSALTAPVQDSNEVAVIPDAAPSGLFSLTQTLQSGAYSISKDKDGFDVIQMEGFSQSASTGNPVLPHKVFDLLVPPDTMFNSTRLQVLSSDPIVLSGTYDIKPAPAMSHTHNTGGAPEIEPQDYANVNGKNMTVYGSDANFPAVTANLLPYSRMRKWSFTRVDFTPFQYNPVSKKLTYFKSVTISISYQKSGLPPASALLSDTVMDGKASQMFLNYTQDSALYQPSGGVKPQASYSYVIITTGAVQAGSSRLASFVTHKQSKGHTVLVATEAQWGAVTGQSPNTRADKIRKWLQDNYISYGIQYVLLIGNPTPYETAGAAEDVPMKMCWPRYNETWETSYKEAPTDYYFADLTGNWDVDGDGKYGEYPHDTGGGGVDLTAEVYVGRIPVYNSDYATLDSILQKTMDYENEYPSTWRKSALLPMSFSDSSTDGAYLAQQMKSNYLDSAGYNSWTMYQQGSDCASANSSFASDQELRAGTYVRDRWSANDYGIVCWWGHGNYQGAYSGYSGCGSGAFMLSDYCPSLDNAHPSFTYQCSCNNGEPERTNNLQYLLLKNGGIATVGATRVSWYYLGQTNFVNSGSNAGIGYDYFRRMVVNNNAAGNALYITKQAVVPLSDPELLMNAFDFNIFGDPAVKIAASSGPPTITNGSGATSITGTSATLNGNLTSTGGETTTVHIYWGDNDGGTTAGSWDYDINLGTRSAGAFSSPLTGLTTGTTYYYRCYATNSAGSTWASSSESFVAVTYQKLLGADTSSATTINGANLFLLDKFIAATTGSLTQVRIYCGSSGNIKAAVYSDSSGSPGSLLTANNAGTPCTAGWNTITVTSTPVTAGTSYWLAYVSDAPSVIYQSGDGVMRWRGATYSSFTFPSSPGTLSGPWGGYDVMAGWGPDLPPAPVAPTVTNASGATGVTNTTATLNGNLTSTGNATTTVHIYWGDNDGGTTTGNWDTYINLGTRSVGAFSSPLTGLTTGTTYYYRCYATNSAGSAWAASSSSFVAQTPTTPEKLLGPDSTAYTSANGANLFLLDKFTATTTGNLNQVRVYCGSSGNVKAALYSDSSGVPGSLLAANDTGTPCTSGWNNITVASTPITSGTSYWLAYISDTPCVLYQTGGGTMMWRSSTYSSFTFPSSAGSLGGPWGGYDILAGWGSTAPPTPVAPTVTNASGATGVTNTTATLNGNLTSTGNATTTVHIYWGDNDGGTTTGNWDTDINLGTRSVGAFSSPLTGLTTGATYYYRCYASNSAGAAWAASSSSFVAQTPTTPEKLLGADSTAYTGPNGANLFLLDKFTASTTGNLNQVRVYCGSSGNVKAALYSDSSGVPGSLLAANDTGTPCTSGWNNITVASTPITSGTSYWLAYIADTPCVLYQTGGGTMMWRGSTYSSFTFPSSAGTLGGPWGGYDILAGWGSTAPPTPPSAPSPTSPGAAITFKWSSSTGASSYTLQLNTSSGFESGTMIFNQNVGNVTSYEVSGLSLATTYYWRINASNSAGTSAWSALRSVIVNTVP